MFKLTVLVLIIVNVAGIRKRQKNEFTTRCDGNVCDYVVHIKTNEKVNGTATIALPRQLLNEITQLKVLLLKLAQTVQLDVVQANKDMAEIQTEINILQKQIEEQKAEYYNKTTDIETKLESHLEDLQVNIQGLYQKTRNELPEGERTGQDLRKVSGIDCASLYKSGVNVSGVYTIQVDITDNRTRFDVYCDMVTDGGGWTVIQRRAEGSDDFYRNWNSYKKGFGGLTHDFWLGLDKIHVLTKFGNNKMRFDLWDWKHKKAMSEFEYVRISDETDKYRILAGKYRGNAGDPFHTYSYAQRMQSMQFSTFDNDNDMDPTGNCADTFNSGWWFNNCFLVNLNGVWYSSGSYYGKVSNGVVWDLWQNHTRGYSLMRTEIKLRPGDF